MTACVQYLNFGYRHAPGECKACDIERRMGGVTEMFKIRKKPVFTESRFKTDYQVKELLEKGVPNVIEIIDALRQHERKLNEEDRLDHLKYEESKKIREELKKEYEITGICVTYANGKKVYFKSFKEEEEQ